MAAYIGPLKIGNSHTKLGYPCFISTRPSKAAPIEYESQLLLASNGT